MRTDGLMVALGLVVAGSVSHAPPSAPGMIQDPAPVEIVVTDVAPGLHVLRGTYANMIASVGEDGVLLVDDDMAPLSEALKATLAGLGGGTPTFILNTHWHGDHTGGNVVFGPGGAVIVAHDNVRTRLSTPQTMLGQVVDPLPEDGWPIVTFDRTLTLHFNGEVIRVMHHPHGHTDGDSVIHFTSANVVHMGDLYFEGYFPNIDLAAGGDVMGYIEAVGAVLRAVADDVTVVPGHGPISTKVELGRFHRMLSEIAAQVQARIDAGDDRERIVSGGVPARWASLHTPEVTTERFLGTVYDSLTRSTSEPGPDVADRP